MVWLHSHWSSQILAYIRVCVCSSVAAARQMLQSNMGRAKSWTYSAFQNTKHLCCASSKIFKSNFCGILFCRHPDSQILTKPPMSPLDGVMKGTILSCETQHNRFLHQNKSQDWSSLGVSNIIVAAPIHFSTSYGSKHNTEENYNLFRKLTKIIMLLLHKEYRAKFSAQNYSAHRLTWLSRLTALQSDLLNLEQTIYKSNYS